MRRERDDGEGVSSVEAEPSGNIKYPRRERLIERLYNHRPTDYRAQMRSKDIKNPAMAIPAWVEWRQEAEDFVAEGEAVPLVEETLADDVDEGTLPSSIRNLSRLILDETTVP